MSRCCAKQAAWCHGAAMSDKRQHMRVFDKSMPSDLMPGWTGFAIRIRTGIRVRCVNYGKRKLIDEVMLGGTPGGDEGQR